MCIPWNFSLDVTTACKEQEQQNKFELHGSIKSKKTCKIIHEQEEKYQIFLDLISTSTI